MGTVTIVGVGLIGGSYGLALRERGMASRVIGCARTQATLDAALQRGAADEVTADVAEACRQADLVILCQPPEAVVGMMPLVDGAVGADAVVTDAASVKVPVVTAAEANLSRPGRFVGGHPMAGSERTGVEHAKADLFECANYVLTPTSSTSDDALSVVRDLAEGLGARVRVMPPEEHDRAVAAASHAPHAVAAALTRAVLTNSAAVEVHGAGLRDTTRVAASDAAMWRQILLANAVAVLDALEQVQGELDALRNALAARDEARVEEWLRDAAVLRRALDTAAEDDA
jgi:prephenate dehydrogenase